MDDDAGRAAGMGGALGMGNLQWAYLHNLIRGWAGPTGRLVRLACQFRSPNLKGQTVTARGRITAVEGNDAELVVDLEVWTEAGEDQVLAAGTAVVALPRRSRPDG